MTAQECQATYSSLTREIEALHEQRQSLLKTFAEEHTPAKVGEVTTINGYAYQYKRMLVTKVSAHITWGDLVIHLTGRVLKKNGEPGNCIGESTYKADEL